MALGLISIAGVPFAGCINSPPKSRRSDQTETLWNLIPKLMSQFNVPGLSLALVQDGQIVASRNFGFRNVHTREPVREDTLFEAASVSKTVFAYAALKLCENGTIGLDEPLSRYTSQPFVHDDARLDKVTARMVLSHTSGFREWRTADEPLIRTEPGTTFEYSGEAYFYLQKVMTEVVGKEDRSDCANFEADYEVCATDFDEFMKSNLLRPLGMNHSGYLWEAGDEHRIAIGHDSAAVPLKKGPPRRPDVARYGAVGNLNTTALDYAKFLLAILSPQPPDPSRLNQKMLREMARPQIRLPADHQIDGCTHWGLGWGIQDGESGPLLVHSGGQSGFRSLTIASIQNKTAFIILTNSDNGANLIYHPDLQTILADFLTV